LGKLWQSPAAVQAADSEFQRVLAEFTKILELQDRSLIVTEDL